MGIKPKKTEEGKVTLFALIIYTQIDEDYSSHGTLR